MDSEQLITLLKRLGHSPRSYSGRGMYGRQCVGIDLELYDGLWNLAREIGAEGVQLEMPDTDNLGRDIIAYWPRFEWPDHAIEADFEEDDDRG